MISSFDTLIILIGTNPLPNFVVAQYFIRELKGLKQIILIHSETTQTQRGTERYAERIMKLIKDRNPNSKLTFHQIALTDVGNASLILPQLQKSLREKLKSSFEIHLNYTGGTKTMGIQTYSFLSKEFPNRSTFSYLDARTFTIVFDDSGRLNEDLREKVKFSTEDILYLHNYSRDNGYDQNLDVFKDALGKFREIIESGTLNTYFNVYDRSRFIKDDKPITNPETLSRNLTDFTAKEPILSIVQLLPEQYRIFNPDGSYRELKSKEIVKTVVYFLDGTWLEYYVYGILKEYFKDQGIVVDFDLRIRRKEWGSTNFQLDLLLIKGYQLVGISCTTSSVKKVCKGKGFEIFLRTKQIGGEEAKAILVTRASDGTRRQLEAELQVDTGGAEHIIVLGEDHLKPKILFDRINKFIK